MSKADQHIDQLFKDKLKKGKISKPGGAEWKNIQGKIGMKNFFGFNPFQFNIFYLTAGIIGAGFLGYHMYDSDHFKKEEEPVKEYCIKNDTMKKQQEKNHHLFHEEIKRVENKHQENHHQFAPSDKKTGTKKKHAVHRKPGIQNVSKENTEKNKKISIVNSDSLDKKSYFCPRNEDSIRLAKQKKIDSLINTINSKELKIVEKPRETVLKFRQDTVVQRDTNIIQRDKLRFKWKKR